MVSTFYCGLNYSPTWPKAACSIPFKCSRSVSHRVLCRHRSATSQHRRSPPGIPYSSRHAIRSSGVHVVELWQVWGDSTRSGILDELAQWLPRTTSMFPEWHWGPWLRTRSLCRRSFIGSPELHCTASSTVETTIIGVFSFSGPSNTLRTYSAFWSNILYTFFLVLPTMAMRIVTFSLIHPLIESNLSLTGMMHTSCLL